MKKQPAVGTRDASHKDADLAHYLGSLQVRYLRILIVRMESRAAVEHLSSILFPKSTRRDWHHQKQPEWRQQRLNSLLLPQGQGSFRPSFSSSSLSPCTMRTNSIFVLTKNACSRNTYKPLPSVIAEGIEPSISCVSCRCLSRWTTRSDED